MKTQLLTVDPDSPAPNAILRAAESLRRGELVAFPTETVYGLGANALDAAAVARIFDAKGRPPTNPIIVHVADEEGARTVVSEWPNEASSLAARFWPGPLTLVLAKRPNVPDVVTAGGPTVGIRVPAHLVALSILRAAGVPVAAPSANRSTEVSPTTAAHVLKGLDGRITMVVDGGATTGGIESTVLDLSVRPARLLRPGLVTVERIEEVIGPIDQLSVDVGPSTVARSPGLMRRHYAPRAKVELVTDNGLARVLELHMAAIPVGWMPMDAHVGSDKPGIAFHPMPRSPGDYASALYSALHIMDDSDVERIIIEMPPDLPEWHAVRDRLNRAAAS